MHTDVASHWSEQHCYQDFFPQTLRMGDINVLSTAERATFPSNLKHRSPEDQQDFLAEPAFANNEQMDRAVQDTTLTRFPPMSKS